MSFFIIEIDNNKGAENYFKQVEERLEDNNMLRNPFNGKIKIIDKVVKDKLSQLVFIDITPVYPNVTPYSWVAVLGIYIIWGFSWFMLPLIIFGLLGFFWSYLFFYIITYFGLRKNGYNGKVKLCRSKKVLHGLIFGG
jgi:hypothetical protein